MDKKMHYEKIIPTENYDFKIFEFHTKSPDRLIPPHWHESGELLFCTAGELEVIFANVTYRLKKNDFLFINSNQVHSSRTPLPAEVLAIQFPLDYLQQLTEGLYLQRFIFNVTPGIDNPLLVDLLTAIKKNFSSEELSERLLVKSQILELFSIFCGDYLQDTANVQSIKSDRYLEKMRQVNEYILANFRQELSIEEVAAAFNYNPSYFSRFYKQFMGVTFSDYLNSLRLEAAFKDLRDTDLNILDISERNGFATVKTFYNVFRKNFGMSPKQYRSQYF